MALEKISQTDFKRFKQREVNRFVSTPEQLLALKICRVLADEAHKNIYLHLCKHTQTAIIEQALSFVTDARAKHKGKLFSWKVKQIRQEWLAQGKNPRRQVRVKIKTPKRTRMQQERLF
jgi:hypothetical protein